jgi:hypothetical protein
MEHEPANPTNHAELALNTSPKLPTHPSALINDIHAPPVSTPNPISKQSQTMASPSRPNHQTGGFGLHGTQISSTIAGHIDGNRQTQTHQAEYSITALLPTISTISTTESERMAAQANVDPTSNQQSSSGANLHERRSSMQEQLTFSCKIAGCKFSFARNADRQRHKDSAHKHEQKFFCQFSGCPRAQRGFARKDNLTQHMNSKQHSKTEAKRPADFPFGFSSEAESSSVNESIHTQMDLGHEGSELRPRKRHRATPIETQSLCSACVNSDAEIKRLHDLVREKGDEVTKLRHLLAKQPDKDQIQQLQSENKRLQAQTAQQTDTIHTLVSDLTRRSGN